MATDFCDKTRGTEGCNFASRVAAGCALLLAAAALLGGGTLAGCGGGEPSRGASSQSAGSPVDPKSARSPTGTEGGGSQSDSLDARGDSTGAPEGMVYVPGGRTRIGITEETWRRVQRASGSGARRPWGRAARPSFLADVGAFFLEEHPVTVSQFRRFVRATGYETQAERFGNAGVMVKGRWRLMQGADWQHPRGPSAEKAPAGHPVTQVSYNDARAYCRWKGRRLPTEVEWEHAARGANNDRVLCPGGQCPNPGADASPAPANTWQGRFPTRNTVADGYRYTAPVGAFGETELGLTDMSGNVWEWTSSWYRPYEQRHAPFRASKQSEKVQRGGSFQCNECGGYRVFARSHATRETSLFHVGFRCAKDSPSL